MAVTGFLPNAVRRLSDRELELFMTDPEWRAVWEAEEWERCQDSFEYWIDNYGVAFPDSGAEPMELWEVQRQVFIPWVHGSERGGVILKSRQIGGSLIVADHLPIWECAIRRGQTGFRTLVLNKRDEEAKFHLDTMREILGHQPAWIRRHIKIGKEGKTVLGDEGKDQAGLLTFPERGAWIRSLTATPKSARTYKANLVICDEFGWWANGSAHEVDVALIPAIADGACRAFYISSGNGDAGDGEAFAVKYRNARDDDRHPLRALFLPSSSRPDRRAIHPERPGEGATYDGWAFQTLASMDYDEAKFKQEYPENDEEALAGQAEGLGFDTYQVRCAIELGKYFRRRWDAGELEPVGGGIEGGIDWGGNHTAGTIAIPLPRGAYFCIDEITDHGNETADVYSAQFCDLAARYGHLARTGQDASFKHAIRSFIAYTQQRVPVSLVKFGLKMRGSAGAVLKHVTVDYIRTMLRYSQVVYEELKERGLVNQDGTIKPEAEIEKWYPFLAIDPQACPELTKQMRNIKKDNLQRLVKGGDDSVDSLISLLGEAAAAHYEAKLRQ